MALTDLVFAGTPLLTGNLVFGDDGSNPAVDALISGDIVLLRPTASGLVVLAVTVAGEVTLARPTLSGAVRYNTDTQRPLVARAKVRWQDAEPQYERVRQRWQDTSMLPRAVNVRYREAVALSIGRRFYWQDADHKKRQTLHVRYQEAVPVGTQARVVLYNAVREHGSLWTRYQDALRAHRSATVRYSDGSKAAREQYRARYQDADPLLAWAKSFMRSGVPLDRGWKTKYQDAVPPRPGRTVLHPVEPPVDLCYTPSPDLLFTTLWRPDGELVFVCENHEVPPEPGETIVVPVKKVYIVLNTATLYRVDGHVLLPTYSMSMSLDVDSWTWSFSASLPARARFDLEPDSDDTPVTVEATLNGVPYRFLVEGRGRDRSFEDDGLRIGGRGLMAELDSPIATVQSFGNTLDRSAEQLAGDILTLNGVPLPGWTVDFQLEDWQVKANQWKKQSSYIEALKDVAAAAGGYLQPHASSKVVRILPRYPALPWAWGDVTPDYELPTAAFINEGTDWAIKARYDRVYVAGQGSGGRVVNVRRDGTAGDNVAPMVTDPLITDVIAGRQRGGAILADTGRITTYNLRGAIGTKDTTGTPVGVIPPGKFIRYVDEFGAARIGITRSVSVDVQMPEIWQTIGVETHE